MDLYTAIKNRRSVRRYLDREVPEEVLDRLLTAAQWAPSWAHTQCVEILVATAPEVRAGLKACVSERNPAFPAFDKAPAIVAFLGKKCVSGFKKGEAATPRGDWMLFDVALAMQNFMLAAHAEGLATVCIGLFDFAKAGELLCLPPEIEVVALTPLGYPDQSPNIPPRRERAKFAHFNRYEKGL